MKELNKAVAKGISTLKQLNFSAIGDLIQQVKGTFFYNQEIVKKLTLFEYCFRQIDMTLNENLDAINQEVITPFKNFIDFEYKDVASLKKQYDDCLKNTKKQKSPGKESREMPFRLCYNTTFLFLPSISSFQFFFSMR